MNNLPVFCVCSPVLYSTYWITLIISLKEILCLVVLDPGIHMDATWHILPIHTLLQSKFTPLSPSLPDSSGPLQEKCALPHIKNCSGTTKTRLLWSQSDRASMGCTRTSPILWGPNSQPTRLKESMTPQDHPIWEPSLNSRGTSMDQTLDQRASHKHSITSATGDFWGQFDAWSTLSH